MSEEQKGELEVAGPGGVSVRTKGYRLMDLVCLGAAFGVGWLVFTLYHHDAVGAERNDRLVSAVKESNNIQREMLQAQREANCLNRLTSQERQRQENIEFCRNLGRGR